MSASRIWIEFAYEPPIWVHCPHDAAAVILLCIRPFAFQGLAVASHPPQGRRGPAEAVTASFPAGARSSCRGWQPLSRSRSSSALAPGSSGARPGRRRSSPRSRCGRAASPARSCRREWPAWGPGRRRVPPRPRHGHLPPRGRDAGPRPRRGHAGCAGPGLPPPHAPAPRLRRSRDRQPRLRPDRAARSRRRPGSQPEGDVAVTGLVRAPETTTAVHAGRRPGAAAPSSAAIPAAVAAAHGLARVAPFYLAAEPARAEASGPAPRRPASTCRTTTCNMLGRGSGSRGRSSEFSRPSPRGGCAGKRGALEVRQGRRVAQAKAASRSSGSSRVLLTQPPAVRRSMRTLTRLCSIARTERQCSCVL